MTVHSPIPGPQGPFAIKICRCVLSNVHPPPASLPVGCGGGERTSCHSFARVGGVRTTQTRPNFTPGRGPCPQGKKHSPSWFYPPDETTQKTEGRPPVNGGLGDDAYEHWRKPSAHRRSPPVTLWFLSGDPERNPPRRAEPFSKKVLLSAPPRPTAAH